MTESGNKEDAISGAPGNTAKAMPGENAQPDRLLLINRKDQNK